MEVFHTHIGPEVDDNLRIVLRSRRLSEGLMVAAFERELAQQLGLTSPVAVNSGTSALYLALRLAGVGSGDRVILPAVTFIATAAAILQCGAVPVFADVDPETGNICPKSVAETIDRCRVLRDQDVAFGGAISYESVKAVIAVHWLGLPCDLDGLLDAANGIPIVQDAAHALGASYKGHKIGGPHWGHVCFSFQATKHLTTGDGGLVCATTEGAVAQAKRLRWFGIDRSQPVGPLGERVLAPDEVGGKYHMNDVAAAIGLGNLEGFGGRLEKRRENWQRLNVDLWDMVDALRPSAHPDYYSSACYAFGMRVERRDDFARAMKGRGVPCSVIASRIDKYQFPAIRRSLPGTDVFDREAICLPCHEALTDDDIDTIIKAVRDGW